MSHHQTRLSGPIVLPDDHFWRKLPKVGGALGAFGIVGSVALTFMGGEGAGARFYYSYLTAYMYFLSMALGGIFFVIVHHAAKAGWNITVRRLAEKIGATMPVLAILFIPVIIGLHKHMLFDHWAGHGASDPIVQGKASYLNVTFFYVRVVIYFTCWIAISRWFLLRSTEQDESGDENLTRRMTGLSYPSIMVFALTLSFAAFDWIMSHDPHWYSTMYGVYYFAGTLVAIFSLMCLMVLRLRASGVATEAITQEHQHDLGKYLFGFVVFWAYIAFSQYMLIWYANIPEETIWFAKRYIGHWYTVGLALMGGHFLLPFFFLMSRHVKRNDKALTFGVIWLLAFHYLDLYYQIMPNISKEGPEFGLIDVTTLLAVGGLFSAYFGHLISQGSIVPTKDPRLHEALAFENYPTL